MKISYSAQISYNSIYTLLNCKKKSTFRQISTENTRNCKNIDPSTIFVSKQEFVRKIRCPVTRLSATRWWTHERRKSVSFYHACSFTYLFIYFLFERSLHFLQFLPIHSLLFYGIRESSSKKSSSAVFLHLLIRNLEIYKKKLYH